jgi:hypothetical protein
MRREGDRFYRVYRYENLGVRRQRPWRHVSAVRRVERRPALRANEVWGVDFVADQLADGCKIRTLTIIYLFTRDCLGIEVGFRLRTDDVVAAINRLKHNCGCRNELRPTTAQSLLELRWPSGHMRIKCAWTSAVVANPPKQRNRGILQRSVPRRMFELALVRIDIPWRAAPQGIVDKTQKVGLPQLQYGVPHTPCYGQRLRILPLGHF